jgi:hypothetical protein
LAVLVRQSAVGVARGIRSGAGDEREVLAVGRARDAETCFVTVVVPPVEPNLRRGDRMHGFSMSLKNAAETNKISIIVMARKMTKIKEIESGKLSSQKSSKDRDQTVVQQVHRVAPADYCHPLNTR